MITRITDVFVTSDGNSTLCKIHFYNGTCLEEFSFNVDYVPKERITWFCNTLKSHIGVMVIESYKRGRKDLSSEMRHLIGVV